MALINHFANPVAQTDVLGAIIAGYDQGKTNKTNDVALDAAAKAFGRGGVQAPTGNLAALAGVGSTSPQAGPFTRPPVASPAGIPEGAWETVASIPTQQTAAERAIAAETRPVNASTMSASGIPQGYLASARATESGGNDGAANPNSSALGRYQFLESTWNGLMQQYPELGLTADGRTNGAQQERAMGQFTQDNARVLSSAGVPVDPGTLYAAHFLGAGGAQKVLTADPNTPMAALVEPAVIQSNPQLQGMTAGAFAQWAQQKGGNQSGGYQPPMQDVGAGQGQPIAPDPETLRALLASEATRSLAISLITAQKENEASQGRFVTEQGADGAIWQRDTLTGEQKVIREPQAPEQRRIVQGPDGNSYYEDGSRVLPGIDAPAAAPDRPIRTGPDGQDRYVDTGELVFPDVAAAPAIPDFEDSSGLRKEIQQLPSYKNIAQALPIYRSMQEAAGRNTKASDLNLVYGLGKIFDPTSVVREGEMVLVQNTASLPDWLQGAIASLNGGAALSPDTRAAIMQEAYGRVQGYDTAFQQDTSQYQQIAGRNNLNPADIIPDFGEYAPWAPTETAPGAPAAAAGTPAQPMTDEEYNALPSGALFIDPDDGQTYKKP